MFELTLTFIYSFDQANIAAKALINGDEYKLSDQLSKYELSEDAIEKICTCKTYSVILGFEQINYINALETGNFNLNKLRSFLLKLKIISSASYIESQGLKFKLYAIPGYKKKS